MPKLTLEIKYESNTEMVRNRQKAEKLIRSGLTSYSCEKFKFSIDKEVKTDFINLKLVRFEEINGDRCMILPSKMNFSP